MKLVNETAGNGHRAVRMLAETDIDAIVLHGFFALLAKHKPIVASRLEHDRGTKFVELVIEEREP